MRRFPAGLPCSRPAAALLLLLLLLAGLAASSALGDNQPKPKNGTAVPSTLIPTSSMPGLKNGSAPIIANTTQPSNSSTQNLTSTTASPKVINASSTTTNPSIHNTTKSATSKPMTTTPMNGTVTTTASRATSPSTAIPVTATPKSASAQGKSSGFDVGSFVGGIMLTLGLLAVAYIGCKTYHSRRGIRYRTIDEHDAII